MALAGFGKTTQALVSVVEPVFSGRGQEEPVTLPQEVPAAIPATSRDELEAQLRTLAENGPKWALLSAIQRANLLEKCMQPLLGVLQPASDASVRVKGSYGGGAGEE